MHTESAHHFFPPEWTAQDAVLLAWPHSDSDWRELFPGIEDDFARIAAAVTQFQTLIIICQNGEHRAQIAGRMQSLSPVQQQRIRYAVIPSNDTWCRDFGPICTVKNGQPILIDFQFNAWGGRYAADKDNRINQELQAAGLLRAPLHSSAMILEGGSIESDGAGTLLTTTTCLLGSNRNAGDRQQMQQQLLSALPVKRILWLEHGALAGDDTDSHIDNLARFVAEDTLVYSQTTDPGSPNHAELLQMETELKTFRQGNGAPYRLVPLPLPAACHSRLDGRRLPASYVNFLIINGAVLVPQFDDSNDAIAISRLQQCFPDRQIIGIASRGFIEQNGGIHCLTMQLPAGTVAL